MNPMRITRPLLIALVVVTATLLATSPVTTLAIAAELKSTQSSPAGNSDSHVNPATADEYLARSSQQEEKGNWAGDAFSDPNAVFSVGTGWPIETGYVVTNNHVVSDSDEIILVDRAGNEIVAWAVLRDEQHDIALLAVRDTDKLPPALPLAWIQENEGADVFTIGFPKPESASDLPSRSIGIISEKSGVNADPNTYQTTVPIQPGNSGGPLLNMKGEVVGVVTAMLAYQDPVRGTIEMVPNASSARKISCVTELFQHLPSKPNKIATLPRMSGNLESLSDRIRHSVMKVVTKSHAN